MGGVDLNTIRELLGHSGYSMTLRFAHLAPEFKLKAVEVLHVAREDAIGGSKVLALVRWALSEQKHHMANGDEAG